MLLAADSPCPLFAISESLDMGLMIRTWISDGILGFADGLDRRGLDLSAVGLRHGRKMDIAQGFRGSDRSVIERIDVHGTGILAFILAMMVGTLIADNGGFCSSLDARRDG